MSPSRLPTARTHLRVDPFGKWLGVETLDLRPGHCRMRLVLRPRMVNVHGIAHGGVIFALADAAFSAAANVHGDAAVALAMSIQFFEGVRAGTTLIAEAREERLGRRSAFYAMTVTDDAGRTVAACQGVVHRRPREEST